MEQKSIDAVVATLSDEEREKLGSLIDECREREQIIIMAGSNSEKNLLELAESAKILCEGLLALETLAENHAFSCDEKNKQPKEKLDAMLDLISRHSRDLENALLLASTPCEQMSKA